MNLMLSVIFSSVLVGLLWRRFGSRQQATIIAVAVIMTGLYFFQPGRFL